MFSNKAISYMKKIKVKKKMEKEEEEGRGPVSPAGICLDLKTLALPEHKPKEPREGVPSHWPGVRRSQGGLRSPLPTRVVGGGGGEKRELGQWEGREGERRLQLMQP